MSLMVEVAVNVRVYGTFDYLTEQSALKPGCRLQVSFGRRKLWGVCLDAPRPAERAPSRKYKAADRCEEPTPLLPAALLALCRWAAAYYHHPIGEVMAAAVPANLPRGALERANRVEVIRRTPAGDAALQALPANASRMRPLLCAIPPDGVKRHGLDLSDAGSRAALNRAIAKGWLSSDQRPNPVTAHSPTERPRAGPSLLTEQQHAVDRLGAETDRFGVWLLQGVTGSGKTEVYLRTMTPLLAKGAQILVLVPEIGLTRQLLQRIRHRFGDAVFAYHSSLTDAERHNSWLAARRGVSGVYVGTRSAVFLPFTGLSMLVVDEEHDTSFKQQEGFRYHARDVAIKRAQDARIPVVLGSATPSLESLHNAGIGKYQKLILSRPVSELARPKPLVVDLRGQKLQHGLSRAMLAQIDRNLDAKAQALIFVNRRGYAAAMVCHDCGWSATCPHCDARLSLHQHKQMLICHHCGARQRPGSRCPSCDSTALVPVGHGTERLETGLAQRYPEVRIERFDSDRISSSGVLDQLLADTESGKIQILVGTQILAKGHHFKGLRLVGVLSVDQALYSADFRATERLGQLFTQVAGRAGRETLPGRVILQTHEPDHPLLSLLLDQGYDGLARQLLEERKQALLPPFAFLSLIRASAVDADRPDRFLRSLRPMFEAEGIEVMGPAPAPMQRRQRRYHAQLLLRSDSRARMHKRLTATLPRLDRLPEAKGVRWSIDVDPVDLF